MLSGCFVGEKLLIEATFIDLVQDRIPLVEEKIRSQSEGNHPVLGAALSHLLSSGGKRIRVCCDFTFWADARSGR